MLVCTSIGEEGLDIGDVDLIVSFDAQASPIRLVQRMVRARGASCLRAAQHLTHWQGRTGRHRTGHVFVLVTEGTEQARYDKANYSKKALQKAILRKSSFNFHTNVQRVLPDEFRPAKESVCARA